jgi:hypothetical protein
MNNKRKEKKKTLNARDKTPAHTGLNKRKLLVHRTPNLR